MKRIGQTMAEQTSISYYQTEFKFNDDRTSKKGPVDLFSEGARLSRREKRELDSETGMYSYGARYYDPSLSIWMSVDPLAEIAPDKTPYHYVSNNPINRIDPDGLTDYTVNKNTGKTEAVKGTETTDGTDRILETDKNGDIKRYGTGFLVAKKNRGKAKVSEDGIKKGLLQDGHNFYTKSMLVDVQGNLGKNDVEDFALKLSRHLDREIGGTYFDYGCKGYITHITIGGAGGNTKTKTINTGRHAVRIKAKTSLEFYKYEVKAQFHTHPSGSPYGTYFPSPEDKAQRNDLLTAHPMMKFYIIARSRLNKSQYERVDYTKTK